MNNFFSLGYIYWLHRIFFFFDQIIEIKVNHLPKKIESKYLKKFV